MVQLSIRGGKFRQTFWAVDKLDNVSPKDMIPAMLASGVGSVATIGRTGNAQVYPRFIVIGLAPPLNSLVLIHCS